MKKTSDGKRDGLGAELKAIRLAHGVSIYSIGIYYGMERNICYKIESGGAYSIMSLLRYMQGVGACMVIRSPRREYTVRVPDIDGARRLIGGIVADICRKEGVYSGEGVPERGCTDDAGTSDGKRDDFAVDECRKEGVSLYGISKRTGMSAATAKRIMYSGLPFNFSALLLLLDAFGCSVGFVPDGEWRKEGVPEDLPERGCTGSESDGKRDDDVPERGTVSAGNVRRKEGVWDEAVNGEIRDLSLPEFAFLDDDASDSPVLRGRTVILHVRSASVMEVLERDTARIKDGVLSYEFTNVTAHGVRQEYVLALHYCATLDAERDRGAIIRHIMKPAAKWYGDYCDWEDARIGRGM